MRYRPFARSGMAVSALSLTLSGRDDRRAPGDWRDVVHAAFEEGVNAFELAHPSPALLAGFAEGAQAVRRSLLFVGLRLDAALEGAGIAGRVEGVIGQTGLGELNLLTADAEGAREDVMEAMQALKARDLVRHVAAAGAGAQLAAHVEGGALDAVIVPFNLLSDWSDRNLVRAALERHVGVIATDPHPPALGALIESARSEAKTGLFKRTRPLAGAGTYAFLGSTPGWSAEQICLSYALTEPAVASVQMKADNRQHLASLAEAADRDLPSAVSAQIEMARFSDRAGGGRRSA